MQNFIYELSCEKDAFFIALAIFHCERGSKTANECQDMPVCLRIIYGMSLHIALSESTKWGEVKIEKLCFINKYGIKSMKNAFPLIFFSRECNSKNCP